MPKLFRNPAAVFLLFVTVFWWVIITFIDAALAVETLSALLLPVSAAMLVRWGPGALRNFRSGALLPRQQLTIAVAVLAAGMSFQGIWRLVYRWLNRPEAMANSHWVGLPIYAFLISGLLYLLATRDDRDPPTRVLLQIVVTIALLIFIAGLFIRA